MGPLSTKVGDHVCTLKRGPIPFILRKHKEYHALFGTAYVHGIMHGKYFHFFLDLPDLPMPYAPY